MKVQELIQSAHTWLIEQRTGIPITSKAFSVNVNIPERARAGGDQLVLIDTEKFDRAWTRDESFYVGPGGTGAAIGGRYERFLNYVKDNQNIDAPEVYVDETGKPSFTNGRHRYAVMRDAGVEGIPMAMSPEAIENASAHDLLLG